MSTLDEAVGIGPFSGGLNTRSIPDLLEDDELTLCLNFDVDLDGSLKTRPAITSTGLTPPSASDNIRIIGSGKISGTTYILGATGSGTYVSTNSGASWSLVTANIANCVVFYNDVAYLIPNTAGEGGYYNGTTFTADANMPTGKSALAFKSRIWVARGSTSTDYTRIQFTDPITAATLVWTASNIIDINAKDGETIQALIVYNDDLMIFKDDSTWLYAFDILPEDGIVRVVNEKIGAASPLSVGTFQNVLYVLHEEQVYEMANYNFTLLNQKVPFVLVNSYGHETDLRFALSIIDHRIVIKFGDNVYVYNIYNNAWSQWGGADMAKRSRWWEIDTDPVAGEEVFGKLYLSGSSVATDGSLFKLQDGSNIAEDVSATMRTKNYDFGEPLSFKRLMWWAVNFTSSPSIEEAWTFEAYADGVNVTSHVFNVGGLGNDRENVVRVPDGLRFRKIYFYISASSGTGAYDRSVVSSLSAILKRRQTVPKQENV